MSRNFRKEELKAEIELMEKEILYFKGEKRLSSRKKYSRLLHLGDKNCLLNEPVYINRK